MGRPTLHRLRRDEAQDRRDLPRRRPIRGRRRTVRIFVHNPGAPSSSESTDAYADGPAGVLPAQTAKTTDLPLAIAAFTPYAPPDSDAVDDDYLATLPWDQTQATFGAAGPLASTREAAVCGWHGRDFDERVGAIALIREDGPLAELVGERLRVTRRVGPSRRRSSSTRPTSSTSARTPQTKT
jgi:hypothetical protein